MKRVILLVFCSLAAVSSFAQTSRPGKGKTDWEEMNLKGRVRSIQEKGEYAREYVFNEKGMLTLETGKDAAGILLDKSIYTYNTKGQLARKIVDPGEEVMDVTYKYNNNGRLVSAYDATINGTTVYAYNKTGQCEKEWVESPDFSSDTTYYSYDERGNCLTIKQEFSSEEYLYNEQNQVIETYVDEYTWKSRYDDHGNLIEDITFGPEGDEISQLSVQYEYDDRGNWIRCLRTQMGEGAGTEVITREISYFPTDK